MMRKPHCITLALIAAISSATVSTSCRKEEPKYFDDISGVYFLNYAKAGVVTDSTSITFAYIDEDHTDVDVNIQVLGRASSEVRPIDLHIAAAGAEEGTDYDLPVKAEVPAGNTSLTYTVRLHRTAGLKTATKMIVMTLHESEDFKIPFNGRFVITFNDQFTTAPEGWMDSFVGEFSQQKFELICSVMGMSRQDFNKKNGITFSRWMYIQTRMQQYVTEQQQRKAAGEDYDPEAFDSEGNPLSFE